MSQLVLYIFNRAGIYTGKTYADICQRTGKPIMRIDATVIPPPDNVPTGSLAMFDTQTEKWGVFTPEPVPEPTIEEKRALMTCTSWQLKRALNSLGLRNSVENIIAYADQDTKDMWQGASTFKRLHPMVLAIAQAINKTDAEIDDLFMLALTFTD